MGRTPTASLAAIVGIGLLLIAAPVAAGAEASLILTSRTVRAGKTITAYGWGCPARSKIRINLDNLPLSQTTTQRDGRFVADITIPGAVASGRHRLSAQCDSRVIHRSEIYVFRFGISVTPRRVQPGTPITVKGRGCLSGMPVAIHLANALLATAAPNGRGLFDVTRPIPGHTKLDQPHIVSASCGGRLVGASLVVPGENAIPPKISLLTMSRTVVAAGQTVSVTQDDCSDLAPVIMLDNKPLPLLLDRNAPGTTLTASVRIPRDTLPGRYRLSANCDGGRRGTTELSILDPVETASIGARRPFGPTSSSDLAIWGGLVSGVAVLLTSLGIARRRSRPPAR